jgi:hypothetical protein
VLPPELVHPVAEAASSANAKPGETMVNSKKMITKKEITEMQCDLFDRLAKNI